MEEAERKELLKRLQEGREALLAELTGLSEAQIDFKPGAERWSIGECVEHLALTGERLWELITKDYTAVDEPIGGTERDRKFWERGADRSRKFVAAEGWVPRGRFGSLQEATEAFLEVHERVVEFTGGCKEDLRRRRANHELLGPVSGYECLILFAMHPLRHVKQMKETKNSPGYAGGGQGGPDGEKR